jgi:hypothetical protein
MIPAQPTTTIRQASSRRRSAFPAGIGPTVSVADNRPRRLHLRNFAQVVRGHRFWVGTIVVELNSANSSNSRLRLAANMTCRCMRSVMA